MKIRKGSWPVLPIFNLFQEIGNVSEAEMYRTFNMGVGMVIVCARPDVARIMDHIQNRAEKCYEIGEVIAGDKKVFVS